MLFPLGNFQRVGSPIIAASADQVLGPWTGLSGDSSEYLLKGTAIVGTQGNDDFRIQINGSDTQGFTNFLVFVGGSSPAEGSMGFTGVSGAVNGGSGQTFFEFEIHISSPVNPAGVAIERPIKAWTVSGPSLGRGNLGMSLWQDSVGEISSLALYYDGNFQIGSVAQLWELPL